MKGGLEMKVQGLKTRKAAPAAECKEVGNQKGSLLLEAIVVLGMIASFTPMLYKHVADRRADIENINRANTLLYLQHKAEDYLKDPDNITALVTELGHNQHKEIYPSEMGAGDNFDGRYIVGIRREDENNKPVLKAMIIDTVHTGSDLRAAKVAELIGISAGIYTAVDPDAAWGINGIWSEPLSRYFDTTNIPTGAVAITTEYNKAKYRVNISDILVDADLDMGEFEVTAEQINAVAIAAQNGTLDQLIAQDVRASNKVVAGKKLCVGGEEDENCIESWEGLGGKDDSDLRLVQECNAGMTESCAQAFIKDLNTSCSKVDEVYDRFGAAYPTPKIYNLTYGSGAQYTGTVRTKCEGTQFVVSDISTSTLTNPVEQVGDTAFGITTPGWYQITLMGESGLDYRESMSYTSWAAGGILIANTYYDANVLITIKGIGGYLYGPQVWGGAGVALWDTLDITGAPKLVAGGGAAAGSGGGYNGGKNTATNSSGYSWNGIVGTNTTYCASAGCNVGAVGGRWWYTGGNKGGYGGTGYCGSGYNCTPIAGGNASGDGSSYFASAGYGNWGDNTLTGGAGYVSIVYCGTSESDCPTICTSDSDCSGGDECKNAICQPRSCSTNTDCTDVNYPYCTNNICTNTPPAGTVVLEITNISTRALSANIADVGSYTITSPGKYKISLYGEAGYSNGYLNEYGAAGGVIKVAKIFGSSTTIKIKGVKGCDWSNDLWGGAGIAMYENDSVKLVAGGGSTAWEMGGGGYIGGWGYGKNTYFYGKGIVSGTSKVYCTSTSCSDEAYGGKSWGVSSAWGRFDGYGGSGYCDSSYCSSENSYEIIPGGNGDYYPSGGPKTQDLYPMIAHGNWVTNTLTGGAGYASITYCGPSADSTCP